MNLLCVVVVLAAAGGALATLALAAVLHPVLHRLRRFAPEVRVRWLFSLLALPIASGLLAVLVAFGPCLWSLVAGLPDGCRGHGGPDFFFCMRMVMRDVPAAWLVTGALLALLGRRVLDRARALFRARAALTQLRRLGRYDAERSLWLVPGDLAIVSGWHRGEIYVGEALEREFTPATFAVLLAHERAHQRRRDLSLKLAARALSAFVPARVRRPLLDELDLAIEQACDALAGEAVRDPLAVVRSLLDVARTASASAAHEFALSFCSAEGHLEARVRALCEPRWVSSRRAAATLFSFAALSVLACIAFDASLHDLTEDLFGRLLG